MGGSEGGLGRPPSPPRIDPGKGSIPGYPRVTLGTPIWGLGRPPDRPWGRVLPRVETGVPRVTLGTPDLGV